MAESGDPLNHFGRVVVAGGAGFLGSHLCDALLKMDTEVICVDNLSTGSAENIADLESKPRFSFVQADVTEGLEIDGPLDAVLHLASPASPPHYLRLPLQTMRTGSVGTFHLLDLARAKDARFFLASTSEVYGDPLVHPQPETYWGNVNPIGPRSVYDESKRFAESATATYHKVYGIATSIARIFNTYGPRMSPSDGRVITNFIVQALRGEPLTVYGTGTQTRSLCYVDDLINAILGLIASDYDAPVNIGNSNEITINGLAELVLKVTKSSSAIVNQPLPIDDPVRRKPDLSLAKRILNWTPEVSLEDGIARTANWLQKRL